MSAGNSAWVGAAALTIPAADPDSTTIIEHMSWDGTGTIIYNSKTFNMLTNGRLGCDMKIDKGKDVVITMATGFATVRWRYEKLG